MKTRLKRGFTLVELIVVIAIIAILATVATVSYMAYVDHANLSSDRQEVAQLNSALTVKKYQLNFNAPQTMQEVRDLLDELIEGDFRTHPRSINQGYHYWFDISSLQLQLAKNIDDLPETNGFQLSLGRPVNTSNSSVWNYVPEAFAYETNKSYLFLDQSGSELSNIISSFYSVSNYETFTQLIQRVGSASLYQHEFETILSQTLFFTNEGNYSLDPSSAKSTMFEKDIELITNNFFDVEGELYSDVRLTQLTLIKFPSTVQYIFSKSLPIGENTKLIFPNMVEFEPDFLDLMDLDEPLDFPTITIGNDEYTLDGEFKDELTDMHNVPILLHFINGYEIKEFTLSFPNGDIELMTPMDIYHSGNETLRLKLSNFSNVNDGVIVSDKRVTYTSSQEEIAEIDRRGVITVHEYGEVTFTATSVADTSISRSVTLYVSAITNMQILESGNIISENDILNIRNKFYNPDVPEIGNEIQLSIGEIFFNTGSENVSGLNHDKSVTFTSSETNIAVVSDSGLVSILASGDFSITISFNQYDVQKTILYRSAFKEENYLINHFDNENFLYVIGNSNTFELDSIASIAQNVDLEFVIHLSVLDQVDNGSVMSQTGSFSYTYDTVARVVKFTGTGVAKLVISVMADVFETGEPIAIDTLEKAIEVVNGFNVVSYEQLRSNPGSTRVMLNSFTATTLGNATFNNNAILYGNGFTIDVDITFEQAGGRLITLDNGTIDNVIIDGPLVPYYNGSSTSNTDGAIDGAYFIHGIYSSGNDKIYNSYISGFRNQIRTFSATSTQLYIENTRFENGFMNINIFSNVELTLKNVTTVQTVQTVKDKNNTNVSVYGLGIFAENQNAGKIILEGEFNQYNWVNQSYVSYLPSDFRTSVNTFFSGSQLNNFKHNINGTTHINTGLLSTSPITLEDRRDASTQNEITYAQTPFTFTYLGQSVQGYFASHAQTSLIKDQSIVDYGYFVSTPYSVEVQRSIGTVITYQNTGFPNEVETPYIQSGLIPKAEYTEHQLRSMFVVNKFGVPLQINEMRIEKSDGTFVYSVAGTFVIQGNFDGILNLQFTVFDNYSYNPDGSFNGQVNEVRFYHQFSTKVTGLTPAVLDTSGITQGQSANNATKFIESGRIGDYDNQRGLLLNNISILDYVFLENGSIVEKRFTTLQDIKNLVSSGKLIITVNGEVKDIYADKNNVIVVMDAIENNIVNNRSYNVVFTYIGTTGNISETRTFNWSYTSIGGGLFGIYTGRISPDSMRISSTIINNNNKLN
ncbi:prepilin-type N-terminal cleavage/methylation domain-containing protein [Acholeplasma equirhinis]|uniref:prepilin-type N-terminal cleavage/methylation domain-containing protein n=1 Tax=Acholeplasma equirhinis TaxID=555393 RepID=UPI00197AE44C|nr:prepilin-type N-terminal cleavage/methylation domain-containing protein [Acholeplasma equirhinis]MBN3491223.1 prepilin-type N-terminal cleavage/methylation domain-containing protein [Acholeplasma equirhinis]